MQNIEVDNEEIPDPSGSTKAFSFRSDSCADSCLGYSEEDDESPLDQKHLNLVHEELEKLNIATDVINKLEVQLDGARECFKDLRGIWSEKLQDLKKKYGSAVDKARPFYEARIQERDLREKFQKAAARYGGAISLLDVAKQQVSLTQDGLNRQSAVQPACLEVLNHHIQRVNEAEAERLEAQDEHKRIAYMMISLDANIRKMEKEQRSSIKKSRPYYDEVWECKRVLGQQKELILRLEAEVKQKKCDYNTSLRNLESISDSIHKRRSIGSGLIRVDPPENPPPYLPTAPPPYDENDNRYIIEQDKDKIIDPVLCLISKNGCPEWEERPRSLGLEVILLAKQLMVKEEKTESYPNEQTLSDVSYRTLPDGLPTSSPSDDSEVSSLASVRTSGIGLTDDEVTPGILRSNSTLIQEIECATNRLDSMLRRSISDAGQESGTESFLES